MMARSPLRNVNDMVLALLLLLAGVGPGVGPGGAAAQLAAKPTRGPHPSSPCPSVFSYEGREPEKNRWYGVILVTTDEALDGLRLNVRLTHRAQILGNFIGDVSTTDNVEFTILSLKEKLSPGPPLPVRIFAAFGDRDDIPYIANIKLNGRTICGNNNPVLGLDTLSRPQSTQSSRVPKPPLSRPAGVGGAGGGAGGAGSAGSAQQFDEEARPRPTPPPTTPRPTPPPARDTATPQATTRSTPAYDPPPNANPDNYYSSSSMGSPNDSPSFSSSNRRNPEQFDGKRPAAARPVDDAYQPQPNYTTTTEGERGVYRPTTERHQKPTTERPAPVYTTKYAPSTERDAYPTTRTTLPPRPPAPSRPAPSSADRRPAPMDVDMSPQPWPTSNYDEPASRPRPDARPDARPAPSPSRTRSQRSTCGTVAPPATPLIINGETSIPGKWPWHVALYKPHGRDWKYQCGGSLVSPTVVVTAAHCVTTTVGRPVGPESLLVFLGKHALRTTSEDGVQDKHVYFIHVHPEYNYTNYRNDIAVLILSSPATITSAVRPVCLWDKEKTDLSNVEGKFGTVVGWGIETDGLLTEELHQALMPVVSPAICVYSYPSFFGVYTNNQTYCAGYSPDQPAAGTSVCNGDSGGGMFFKRDEDVPDDEAVWMLRGLVSLSVRTKQDRCDPSHFVVFTDVAKYVDWLENFLIP